MLYYDEIPSKKTLQPSKDTSVFRFFFNLKDCEDIMVFALKNEYIVTWMLYQIFNSDKVRLLASQNNEPPYPPLQLDKRTDQ